MKQFVGSIRRPAAVLPARDRFGVSAASCPAYGQNAPKQQGPPVIRSIEIQYVGPANDFAKSGSSRRFARSRARRIPNRWPNRTFERSTRPAQVQNVRIFAEPEGDGVKVMVVLQTRSLVNEIEIVGADEDQREEAAQEHRPENQRTAQRRGARKGTAKDHRRLPGQGLHRTSTSSSMSRPTKTHGTSRVDLHGQRRSEGQRSARSVSKGTRSSATRSCASR